MRCSYVVPSMCASLCSPLAFTLMYPKYPQSSCLDRGILSIESQLEASYVLTVGVLAVHGRRMHTSRISDRFASFDVVYIPCRFKHLPAGAHTSLTVGEVLIFPVCGVW